MQASKLVFSDTELQLAQNREVILTKMAVIQKVYEQFGSLGTTVFEYFSSGFEIYRQELSVLPKISKGENYLGYPWVMLDYPRYFDGLKGHFALRTFFWWGHYYLIQLHLSGQYAQLTEQKLQERIIPSEIEGLPVWIGYPKDPWNYQLPQEGMQRVKPDYLPIKNKHEAILKIAVPVPIHQSEKMKKIALALCFWV